MRAAIRLGLVAGGLDAALVDEFLTAYEEAKRNYYLGGLRLNAVEGGRFCEAAFRFLQHRISGTSLPLGSKLDSERAIVQLSNAPKTHPDSVRLYIPRALRVVYDIRNNRDAAHLADGIDPNLQDATLVIAILDWVVAEFVRLYHSVAADEAQQMVSALVTRQAPTVQVFGEDLKVLRRDLGAADHALVLLYQRGGTGTTLKQLREWSPARMRSNLGRTVRRLDEEKRFVHEREGKYTITQAGQRYVEQGRLLDPLS